MTSLIRTVLAVLAGVLLGLFVTILSLDPGRGGLKIGPWRGDPGDRDPYALATTARAGLLPLGAGEGLGFTATTDSRGDALVGACDYVLRGPMPAARFWTVSLLSEGGFPVAGPAARYALTSAETLRYVDEPVRIVVSAQAQPGNWLPSGDLKRYVLMLRLYDTGLSTVGTTLGKAALPAIERGACR